MCIKHTHSCAPKPPPPTPNHPPSMANWCANAQPYLLLAYLHSSARAARTHTILLWLGPGLAWSAGRPAGRAHMLCRNWPAVRSALFSRAICYMCMSLCVCVCVSFRFGGHVTDIDHIYNLCAHVHTYRGSGANARTRVCACVFQFSKLKMHAIVCVSARAPDECFRGFVWPNRFFIRAQIF